MTQKELFDIVSKGFPGMSRLYDRNGVPVWPDTEWCGDSSSWIVLLKLQAVFEPDADNTTQILGALGVLQDIKNKTQKAVDALLTAIYTV